MPQIAAPRTNAVPRRRFGLPAGLALLAALGLLAGWLLPAAPTEVPPQTAPEVRALAEPSPAPVPLPAERPPGTLGSSRPRSPAAETASPAGTLRVQVERHGLPRAGVRVKVRGTTRLDEALFASTGPDGGALFPLAHGLYYVEIDEEGLAAETATVTHAWSVTAVTLHARGAGTVAGTVRDARGRPLAGAFLQFDAERGEGGLVATDAAGRYSIRLRPGRYALKADAKGYAGQWRRGLSVEEGARREEDFALGGLDGALTVETLCDLGPCVGAEVVAVWPTGALGGVTDASGTTTIAGLPGEQLEVTAVWRAGAPDERRARLEVRLAEGERAAVRSELLPVQLSDAADR